MITSIKTTPLDYGFVKFTIKTDSEVKSCIIEYGDGHNEVLTLPPNTSKPTMHAEHKFKRGTFRVMIVIYNNKDKVDDTRYVNWLENR